MWFDENPNIQYCDLMVIWQVYLISFFIALLARIVNGYSSFSLWNVFSVAVSLDEIVKLHVLDIRFYHVFRSIILLEFPCLRQSKIYYSMNLH